MRKIKVFIVEDSILMQKIITDILSSDPNIEVIGTAKYGKDALERIPDVKPDIVTLDINLPDMDGLNVLRGLMNRSPVKVIMVSAYTQKGAETTMRALELGALDFIPKPSGEVSLDLYNFKDEIISKIKLVDSMDLGKSMDRESIAYIKEVLEVKKIVVIGASTGGPKAIMNVMSKVALDTETSFLIVQHMPKEFTRSFAERISWYSSIRTKEGAEGDPLMTGAAYVAPGGYHMVLEKTPAGKGKYNLRLDETPLVHYIRPAVDVTMKSVADVFEGRIIAVILTGMGKDGLEGVRSIKKKGGKVIVQDEFTSVVYGMPKVVVEEKLADAVLPLEDIPRKISYYLANG